MVPEASMCTHTHVYAYLCMRAHTQRVWWGERIEGSSLLFTFMTSMLRSLSEGMITGQQLHLCFPNCITNLWESRVPKSTIKTFNNFSKPFLPQCLPVSFHCTAFIRVHLSFSWKNSARSFFRQMGKWKAHPFLLGEHRDGSLGLRRLWTGCVWPHWINS